MTNEENNNQTTSNSSTSDKNDSSATSESNKEDEKIVDVIIAGAGLAGLTTGLCLHRAGYSVIVGEEIKEMKSAGYGLNLQPYCIKLLYELGLEEDMKDVSIESTHTIYYSRNGQFVSDQPRGNEVGYKWPMLAVHRGNFQKLLFRHLQKAIGEESLRLSQKLVAFRSLPTHVEADFLNPATNDLTTVKGKVLIAADGINSIVRKRITTNEPNPVWSGMDVWAGMTEVDQLYLDGHTMICAGNPDKCFLVTYPVSSNLVNWGVAIRVASKEVRAAPPPMDWKKSLSIDDILPRLEKMKLDFLDIHHLVKSAEKIDEFSMTDHDPLSSWVYDRVALVGDAAHPMHPFGGSGASQAILDARALVLAFREHGVTSQGLQAYDEFRRSAANTLILSAQDCGVHKFLQVIDERLKTDSDHVEDVMSKEEMDAIIQHAIKQAGPSPQELNAEPSLF